MSVSAKQRTRVTPRSRQRRAAIASVLMPAVFGVWTIAFIVVSGLVAGASSGGVVPYIRPWLPWLGVTALWVLPLAAGLVLGVHAARRGGGPVARVGIVVNAVALVVMVTPSLVDRLIS